MVLSLQKALNKHEPFLSNKYTEWYMSLVSKDCNDAYIERHHILPVSLYPEYRNSKWNLVKLSARKHFLAHMILPKMFSEDSKGHGKMLAAAIMIKCNKDEGDVNSYLYEKARINYSNFLKGSTHKAETKKKISDKLMGIVRPAMSEETKERMRQTKRDNHVPKIWMNKNGVQTKVLIDEIDKYSSNGWIRGIAGKHITEEFKKKLSDQASVQWKKLKEAGFTRNIKKEA